MNRRAFLARVGVGGAAAAVGVVVATGAASVAGAVGGRSTRRDVAASVPAETATGTELVVNGSFEDGPPGANVVGWQVLV